MKKYLVHTSLFIVCFLLVSCSATKIIRQYKNPETYNFEANKVLVVGISSDTDARRMYEKKMTDAFEKEGVISVKSIDFFETSFTQNEKSIEELNAIEDELLDAGFDAIIATKIIGKESRVTLVDAYKNYAKEHQGFGDYYYKNQHLYSKQEEEQYQVYTTETSLFCICPTKERELLWTGEIEVVDATKIHRNINSYIQVLFKNLKENKLLLLEQ